MKMIYAIEIGFQSGAPKLIEATVLSETPAFYIVNGSSRVWRYRKRVTKSTASLTANDAWTGFIKEQRKAVEAARQKWSLERERLTLAERGLAQTRRRDVPPADDAVDPVAATHSQPTTRV